MHGATALGAAVSLVAVLGVTKSHSEVTATQISSRHCFSLVGRLFSRPPPSAWYHCGSVHVGIVAPSHFFTAFTSLPIQGTSSNTTSPTPQTPSRLLFGRRQCRSIAIPRQECMHAGMVLSCNAFSFLNQNSLIRGARAVPRWPGCQSLCLLLPRLFLASDEAAISSLSAPAPGGLAGRVWVGGFIHPLM